MMAEAASFTSPLEEMASSSSTPIQPPSQELEAHDDSTQNSAVSYEAKELQDAKDKVAKEKLEVILKSEIGIGTLLTRLKQSIGSARDISVFFKKRGGLEEEHSAGIKKLVAAARSEHRQGTYSRAHDEIQRIHDRMADHGLQFSVSLLQMSEDLTELANNIERGRKQWKQTGLNAEKKVQDAEAQVEKAKAKYDSLAEQYDRVRTGDKGAGKFGLKGHKSAAQLEEEVFRKLQTADSEYQARVQAARSARQELVSSLRPQTIRNLQSLIFECDSGLTLQLQKYAAYNEKLLLGQGLCVSPLKNGPVGPRSLREVIHQIDSEKDLDDYVLSFSGTPGAVASPEAQYIRHPALATTNSSAAQAASAPPSQTNTQNKRQSISMAPLSSQSPVAQIPPSTSNRAFASPDQGFTKLPSLSAQQQLPHSFGQSPQHPPYPSDPHPPVQQSQPYPGSQQHGGMPPPSQQGPPRLPDPMTSINLGPTRAPMMYPPSDYQQSLPPLNPVFGIRLEELYTRDGTAVPMIVYQCIQAVELFGLDVEGIYRLSGSATHIGHMKALFDNDSSKVDFTNPESFYHDVNSVAGLLKQFFRDLPDPLFAAEHYSEFINAARIEHDTQRRDAIHGIINNLPDPNYATLRALILHLNKVQERSMQNRMNAGNLAICFGPTVMGASTGGNIADAGWQARVVETILLNTFQIFDDD